MTRLDEIERHELWQLLRERFRSRSRDVSVFVRLANTLTLGSFFSLAAFAFAGLHAHWQVVFLLGIALFVAAFVVLPYNLFFFRRVSLRDEELDVVPTFGKADTLSMNDLEEVTFEVARCVLVFRRPEGRGVDVLYLDPVDAPNYEKHRAIRVV